MYVSYRLSDKRTIAKSKLFSEIFWRLRAWEQTNATEPRIGRVRMEALSTRPDDGERSADLPIHALVAYRGLHIVKQWKPQL